MTVTVMSVIVMPSMPRSRCPARRAGRMEKKSAVARPAAMSANVAGADTVMPVRAPMKLAVKMPKEAAVSAVKVQ